MVQNRCRYNQTRQIYQQQNNWIHHSFRAKPGNTTGCGSNQEHSSSVTEGRWWPANLYSYDLEEATNQAVQNWIFLAESLNMLFLHDKQYLCTLKMCKLYLTLDKFSSVKWATYLESLRRDVYEIPLCYFSSFKDATLQGFFSFWMMYSSIRLLGYS